MEQNDDINDEEPLARLDADIALLAGEMSRFAPRPDQRPCRMRVGPTKVGPVAPHKPK